MNTTTDVSYRCPGCNTRLTQSDMTWPIPDICERLLPGERMPIGECPDCQGLVYKTSVEKL